MTKLKAFEEKSNKRNDARLEALLLYLSLYGMIEALEFLHLLEAENGVNSILENQKRNWM